MICCVKAETPFLALPSPFPQENLAVYHLSLDTRFAAREATLHAVAEAGLVVPRDVSVVGFDDVPDAAHFAPPLTTVRQDFAEVGRRAIARLLAELSGSPADAVDTVPASLVLRESTARV